MDRREELERWIAGSRATQKKLKTGLVVAGVVALGLFGVSRAAGVIGILIVAFVAIAGFWITGGHISDWEDRIYKLDHPAKPSSGRRGRYQAD